MFHLIHWSAHEHPVDSQVFIDTGQMGVEATYTGSQHQGTRYLYPRIDVNQGTVRYYAFDTTEQKQQFLELLKITGIWTKNAYQLAMTDRAELAHAIETFDIPYFTSFPGIGQKTAKRIVVELTIDLEKEALQKLAIDETILKDIVSSLSDLGYERQAVKTLLPECPHPLDADHLQQVMKWLIEQLAKR